VKENGLSEAVTEVMMTRINKIDEFFGQVFILRNIFYKYTPEFSRSEKLREAFLEKLKSLRDKYIYELSPQEEINMFDHLRDDFILDTSEVIRRKVELVLRDGHQMSYLDTLKLEHPEYFALHPDVKITWKPEAEGQLVALVRESLFHNICRRRVSQKEMAEIMGVSVRTIRNLKTTYGITDNKMVQIKVKNDLQHNIAELVFDELTKIAFKHCGYTKTKARRLLGVSEKTLNIRLGMITERYQKSLTDIEIEY